jgi:hypothetical protein
MVGVAVVTRSHIWNVGDHRNQRILRWWERKRLIAFWIHYGMAKKGRSPRYPRDVLSAPRNDQLRRERKRAARGKGRGRVGVEERETVVMAEGLIGSDLVNVVIFEETYFGRKWGSDRKFRNDVIPSVEFQIR